jgi:hypothetical protein
MAKRLMSRTNLESMSIDELWTLRKEVLRMLKKRIADQKSILEKRGKRIADFLIVHRQRGKRGKRNRSAPAR